MASPQLTKAIEAANSAKQLLIHGLRQAKEAIDYDGSGHTALGSSNLDAATSAQYISKLAE
jgi:hypothetical protein